MLGSYSEGFMTKCAEHGLPFETAFEMLKIASSGMEKKAWQDFSDVAAHALGNPWWAGGRATAPIAASSNNFVRNQIGNRNTNFTRYLDQVDAGQAGTSLGRAWHGLNDNWIGRNIFGIRGSQDYIHDAEKRRIQKATALANKDVKNQQELQDLMNGAPQLDQLAVSGLRGYQQHTSANPKAIPKMKTTFGQNGRNGRPGAGGYRPGYQQRPYGGGYRPSYGYRPRMADGY